MWKKPIRLQRETKSVRARLSMVSLDEIAAFRNN